MPPIPYARIASTLLMTLCIGLFGYSTAASFWHRLVHVDVLEWPLGLPHPQCPSCRSPNTTIIAHDPLDDAEMRCDQCRTIFTTNVRRLQ